MFLYPEFVLRASVEATVGPQPVSPTVTLGAAATAGLHYITDQGVRPLYKPMLRTAEIDMGALARNFDAKAEVGLDARINVRLMARHGFAVYGRVRPYLGVEKCRWGDHVDQYGGVRLAAGGEFAILSARSRGEVPTLVRRRSLGRIGLDANNNDTLFDELIAGLTVTAGVKRLSIAWDDVDGVEGQTRYCGISYNIYRDGWKIASNWPRSSFVDVGLDAENSYSYEISVNLPSGRESARTAPVAGMPLPNNRFRDCAECPAMVAVPPGTFTMGAPESEPLSQPNERPQRTVSIPAFAASAHEVTFAQWDACMAAGGCGGYTPNDYNELDGDGFGRGDRPVINVSWHDAQLYVDWLSRSSGQRYRLLTESEWEYAARAGTATPFHTGETITPEQANFDGLYDYPAENYDESGLYHDQTVPVGTFAPNAFGLYDMHGNVLEWVQDCYGHYASAPNDGSAVEGDGCRRVLRGGSWTGLPWSLRSAWRDRSDAGHRFIDIGFRVARTL